MGTARFWADGAVCPAASGACPVVLAAGWNTPIRVSIGWPTGMAGPPELEAGVVCAMQAVQTANRATKAAREALIVNIPVKKGILARP